jgi:poly(A) polymerase
MKFADVAKMKESTLKRFLRQPYFDEHLELHRLDVLSSNGQLGNYNLVKHRLENMPCEELKPPPLLNGDDLIAAGYQPGPKFGEMLAAVDDAQLEGRIHSREEGLDLVQSQFGAPQRSN